jgi:hypothetical protein
LHKHQISQSKWDALAVVREILLVSHVFFNCTGSHNYIKVPDAFQQKLSAEKTPTLCNAMPAFDAMVTIWKEQQQSWGNPISNIIQEGIDKLDEYHDRLEPVPAYTIAMCMSFNLSYLHCLMELEYLVLNPSMKLRHIPPENHHEAKSLLRRTVRQLYYCVWMLS